MKNRPNTDPILRTMAALAIMVCSALMVQAAYAAPSNLGARDDSLSSQLQRRASWLLGQAEIPMPLDSAYIDRVENRGFVEAILAQAADSVLLSGDHPRQVRDDEGYTISLSGDVISARHPSLATPTLWSGASEEELREYYKATERLVKTAEQIRVSHSNIMSKAFGGLFKKKMRVSLLVPIGEDGISGSALLAEATVHSRDMAGSKSTVDYAHTWYCVSQLLAEKKLVVDLDAPRNGRFRLETAKIGSKDENWFYQKRYIVEMWDPYADSDPDRGQYCKIKVELVVGRRKQGVADWSERTLVAGPEVEDVLTALNITLKTCKKP